MSFILDALRKSESERQREAAPVLARAPLAFVRRETPLWSWLAIASLSLALLGLAAAWWFGLPGDGWAGRADAPAALAGPAAASGGDSAPASGLSSGPTSGTPNTAGAGRAIDPSLPQAYGAAAGGNADTSAGAAAAAVPRPISDLRRLDPSLPEDGLDMLQYDAADPAGSAAWIGGRRYIPGEQINNGPEVISIRRDGVILGFREQRFLLTPR